MAVFDIFKRLVNQNAVPGERRVDERLRASLGARVLVVDDSATIRAVLGKMLVQDGYEVLKAADGESAVEMAQSQFPDLIFLDIVLPGVSGFAVLRSLRRDTRTHDTPIIMMSGNQQATEQFYVQRFGADGFLKKPFGRAEVFHAIRSLVQAGRVAARTEAPPVETIPEGMTAEEWNAIPDVALPDEAHLTSANPVTPGASGPDSTLAASAGSQSNAPQHGAAPEPAIPLADPVDSQAPESVAETAPTPASTAPISETHDRGPEIPLASQPDPPPAATSPEQSIPASAFSLAMRPTLGRMAATRRGGTPPLTVRVKRPDVTDRDSAEDAGEAAPDPHQT